MNKTKVKIVLGVLVVFLSGVLIGGMGTGMYVKRQIQQFTKRPQGTRKELFMERLSKNLHLTAAQKPEIEKISEEIEQEIQQLLKQSRTEFESIMESSQKKLKSVLTPEQQREFDKMTRRMKKRWPKGVLPPGEPPPLPMGPPPSGPFDEPEQRPSSQRNRPLPHNDST